MWSVRKLLPNHCLWVVRKWGWVQRGMLAVVCGVPIVCNSRVEPKGYCMFTKGAPVPVMAIVCLALVLLHCWMLSHSLFPHMPSSTVHPFPFPFCVLCGEGCIFLGARSSRRLWKTPTLFRVAASFFLPIFFYETCERSLPLKPAPMCCQCTLRNITFSMILVIYAVGLLLLEKVVSLVDCCHYHHHLALEDVDHTRR